MNKANKMDKTINRWFTETKNQCPYEMLHFTSNQGNLNRTVRYYFTAAVVTKLLILPGVEKEMKQRERLHTFSWSIYWYKFISTLRPNSCTYRKMLEKLLLRCADHINRSAHGFTDYDVKVWELPSHQGEDHSMEMNKLGLRLSVWANVKAKQVTKICVHPDATYVIFKLQRSALRCAGIHTRWTRGNDITVIGGLVKSRKMGPGRQTAEPSTGLVVIYLFNSVVDIDTFIVLSHNFLNYFHIS